MTSLIAYELPDVRGINYIIIVLNNGITESSWINQSPVDIHFISSCKKRKIGGVFDAVLFLK